jgi:hypothetical protein
VFKGIHPITKQWRDIRTDGGKLFQNCFAAGTKILTRHGIKDIISVVQGDEVWDGEGWVTTDGSICQGTKKVGIWLGVQITGCHPIYDGKHWRKVRQMEGEHVISALKWAHDSVNLQLPFLGSLNTVKQNAYVSVDEYIGSLMQRLEKGLGNVCTAHLKNQEKLGKSIKTYYHRTFISFGVTGIRGCTEDAITQNARNIKAMEGEGSKYAILGSKIKEVFLRISKLLKIGINQILTWIEPIIIKVTNLVISAWCPEKSDAGIRGPLNIWTTKVKAWCIQNLSSAFFLSGKVKTPSISTLIMADPSNGLWQSTTKEVKVYDLLNCGRRNRFTILTNAGPIIVHNCVQAISRDFLKYGQKEAWNSGYKSILEVYDELVCEVPDTDEYNVGGLIKCMTTNPPWALDMPLNADGFEDYRYHKAVD